MPTVDLAGTGLSGARAGAIRPSLRVARGRLLPLVRCCHAKRTRRGRKAHDRAAIVKDFAIIAMVGHVFGPDARAPAGIVRAEREPRRDQHIASLELARIGLDVIVGAAAVIDIHRQFQAVPARQNQIVAGCDIQLDLRRIAKPVAHGNAADCRSHHPRVQKAKPDIEPQFARRQGGHFNFAAIDPAAFDVEDAKLTVDHAKRLQVLVVIVKCGKVGTQAVIKPFGLEPQFARIDMFGQIGRLAPGSVT